MNRRSAPDSTVFDLVIIGGGINGAAIARDASLRGLSVCLLEKGDFGSGASSKTSKMAHGGLRYLEHFHLSLVRESLKERGLLFKNAPHLARPLPFLIPIYENSPHYTLTVRLGLFLYDLMGGSKTVPRHSKVGREGVLKLFPGLAAQGLKGGCLYYDGQMSDTRLLIENVLSAERAGASIHNYTYAGRFLVQNGTVRGVSCVDSITGNVFEVHGRVIVDATGAWSGRIGGAGRPDEAKYLAPTKGVHLVVPQVNGGTALLLNAPQDGRVFFVLPWGNESLIGTTDTFYSGDPDDVRVTREDIRYLLDAYNAFFPENKIDEGTVLSSFAGLRPLSAAGKKGVQPSEIGRESMIRTTAEGVITVSGGKYTTHRLVAEKVVDTAVSLLDSKQYSPCSTENLPLPGAIGALSAEEMRGRLSRMGLSAPVVDHLLSTYGTRSLDVVSSLEKDPSGAKALCPFHPHIAAEIDYAVRNEHVCKLSDWFFRRTAIGYGRCGGRHCKEAVAERIGALLGWSKKQIADEIAEYDLQNMIEHVIPDAVKNQF